MMVLTTVFGKQYFDDELLRYMRLKKESKVKEMLENCNPAGLMDSSQSTLLHYAAKYDNSNLINYLVEAGCQVDAQNELGRTPLTLAIEGRRSATVEKLLRVGANIYVKDNQGRSALQLAFDPKAYRCLKIIEMCIDQVCKRCEGSNDRIAETLIEANCPLYFAIYAKSSAVTDILINHGLPVNLPDRVNWETPLHVAARIKDVENVKLLVNRGANVNAIDHSMKKPFLSSPVDNSDENLEILRTLLKSGMILTSLNYGGQMHGHSLRYYDPKFIELIFDHDVDLMARDQMNNTFMHILAFVDGVNYEKLKGKEFDPNGRNRSHQTPLELAFECDNEKYVDFLLDIGVKIHHASYTLLELLAPIEVMGSNQQIVIIERAKLDQKFIHALMRYDEGIRFVLKYRDKIFNFSLQRNDSMANYVIALAAMLDASEVEIKDDVRKTINAKKEFRKLYRSYKKELANMKEKIVYESVSLYKLLTHSKKRIELYMRNESSAASYVQMEAEFDSNSYYIDVLQKRVKKAIQSAELKKAASLAFCKLFRLKGATGNTISEYVLEYLNVKDLENLIDVQD